MNELTLPDTVFIPGRGDTSRLALPSSHPESWPARWLDHYGTDIVADLGEEWFDKIATVTTPASPGRIIEYALNFLWANLEAEEAESLGMGLAEAEEALALMSTDNDGQWWAMLFATSVAGDEQAGYGRELL